jgi:hypothetical protein
MANPSKRDSAAKKVVVVARSIVTYQIGLPAGCVQMQRTLLITADGYTVNYIYRDVKRRALAEH